MGILCGGYGVMKNNKLLICILHYVVLVLISLIFLFPFVYMFNKSLMTSTEINSLPVMFFPKALHWENYSKCFDKEYLNYLLNTEKYKKAIKEKATGTSNSMKNITKEDFLNTLLPIPKDEEQNIISKYLLQMDSKIKTEEQYLNKYKQIKQGLMKRLLTPPADAEIVEE